MLFAAAPVGGHRQRLGRPVQREPVRDDRRDVEAVARGAQRVVDNACSRATSPGPRREHQKYEFLAIDRPPHA
ncbi:hypothetical protein K1T35_35165 [Pseudonocardia sp. DSM 110487]|uniref:hypothetical protein n=1 Tax=Pseudonocardia sp. DSM 110487 TaxID=2865833 RepID=UPI001C6A2238|nr:hypothetical protein [Pseudonocardia sp. DSM 110487]QYN33681.1 hypothetical protein K1T35_35165 [Pseudonocardia sp. DSM 110487]